MGRGKPRPGSHPCPTVEFRMFPSMSDCRLSNVHPNVRKYVATWLELSRESDRPAPGPFLAELCITVTVFTFSHRKRTPQVSATASLQVMELSAQAGSMSVSKVSNQESPNLREFGPNCEMG